jgi:VIT1/CCC1 family predicted Fe2+/Mn2+ transporter
LNRQDIVSFVQIFILVFFCTLPIALPFALVNDLYLAMRISNGLALVMLFSGGYFLAGYSGFKRLPTAINFTVLGLLLVAITIALGG